MIICTQYLETMPFWYVNNNLEKYTIITFFIYAIV